MNIRDIRNSFNKNLNDNYFLYIIAILFICVGVILGIYTVKNLTSLENETIINYLDVILKGIINERPSYSSMFVEALKNNTIFLLGYWILGFTVVGSLIVLLLNVIKGFIIGFTFSFVVANISGKGIFLAMLGIVPQNLIYICCIIMASVMALRYSLDILKFKKNTLKTNVINYSLNYIVIFLLIFIGASFETLVTPFIFKIIM